MMKSTRFLKELGIVIRSVRPILLVSLLILGGLAGFSIRQFLLVSYQARLSLPLSGDFATFREAEGLFSSAAMFERYGVKHNLVSNRDFQRIYQQFVRNLNGPIRIEHAFRLLRKDIRDLPDIPKDELNRQMGFVRGLQSDVQVYATAREPEAAIRLAKIAMEYVRDCLANASLRSSLQRWGPAARLDLAATRETVAKLRSDLESSNRRIESMERLKDRFKDEKDISVLSSGPSPVQVQVTGTDNLPPLQQLIGLETKRADQMENLRLAEFTRLRLETLVRFADLFDSRLGDGASIDLAKEVLSQALPIDSTSRGNETNAKEQALASIGSQMQAIITRFSEARTDPIEPEARSVSVGRGLATLFGLVLAAALWLLLVLIFPSPRSGADGVT